MKSIIEYINENIISIFESNDKRNKPGIKINVDDFKNYLDNVCKGKNGIVSGTENIPKDYIEKLGDYLNISKEALKTSVFHFKTGVRGTGLTINGNTVDKFSDKDCKKYKLNIVDDKHYDIEGLVKDVYVTHTKKISGFTKIWPKEWQKIVEYNNNVSDGKEPNNIDLAMYPSFGNKGAYILRGDFINKFKQMISNEILNVTKSKNNVLYRIFNADDPFNEMKIIDDSEDKILKAEVKDNLANVLSEPLAILAVIKNQNNIINEITNKIHINDKQIETSKIDIKNIAIPISENYKLADFFVMFAYKENNKEILFPVPISVKSGKSSTAKGNSASFMRYLSFDNEYFTYKDLNYNGDTDVLNTIVSLYIAYIYDMYEVKKLSKLQTLTYEKLLSYNNGKKIEEKSIIPIQNFALDCLEYAYYKQPKITRGQPDLKATLYDAFKYFISKLNKDLYNQLVHTSESENFIEVFFVNILKFNDALQTRLKHLIGANASCYKITINNNGNCHVTDQSKESNANVVLKAQHGGRHTTLKFDKNKIVGAENTATGGNGQYLCYSFIN